MRVALCSPRALAGAWRRQPQRLDRERFRLALRALSCKMRLMEPTATQSPASCEPTATFPVVTEHIGIRPGYCGGEPHILGHRIKVRHVAAWHEQMGMTPTEIAATYP